MELKMTWQEMIDFGKSNNTAMDLIHLAVDDYKGSRCCMINNILGPGFILAEQAAEKYLKCLLKLISPEVNLRKFNDHKLTDLIEKINEFGDYGLDKYFPLAKRLSDLYELVRYPDNKLIKTINSYGMRGDEIDNIDEFIFHLMEKLPMPDEIKFNGLIYGSLFNFKGEDNTLWSNWIMCNNKQFEIHKNELRTKFIQVFNYIHPHMQISL